MIHFKLQRTLKSSEGEMLLDVSTEIQQGTFMGLYGSSGAGKTSIPVSYTHLRAHETLRYLVCRLLLEKKNK